MATHDDADARRAAVHDADTRRAALRAEEGDLAAFFDAARAAPPAEAPTRFLDAVLADAADITAARAPAAPPAPARRRRRVGLADLLGPLGGWAGAAALAGCLALGFWAGALGTGATLADAALWTDAALKDVDATGVDGFFDLDPTEG